MIMKEWSGVEVVMSRVVSIVLGPTYTISLLRANHNTKFIIQERKWKFHIGL